MRGIFDSESDCNAGCRSLCFAVVDSLDVVTVGIQHECRVVTWVIRPLAWRAIVYPTILECHLVKRIDRRAIRGLKG
jgi:hypothetical protein